MNTDLISKVRSLRSSLSEKIVMINKLDKTRETSLAYTNAEEAFMFLGKCLQLLGAKSPYPSDTDKASATIADSVDPNTVELPVSDTYLGTVKAVRVSLQKVISSSVWNELFHAIGGRLRLVNPDNRTWMAASHSLMCLMGSRMWLGMELNNIARELYQKPLTKKESYEKPKEEKGTAKADDDKGKIKEQSVAKPKADQVGESKPKAVAKPHEVKSTSKSKGKTTKKPAKK